ncbi:hypothetical protein [Chitinophaga pinensis]|uniref:Uncharacterized protein n=1 Tax=Chitinophaga pinensis (strain ATCC 43595 / DSM 2588 / LMG 13176 / NBRC 15968 / NCIMB 11800 / UQM 2034) TaxID=485918 RepID=A0A979G9Y1_CHIPD|nr:hypothetical protein [Chitinophaga pinensis]ACU63506.1 hypothetical protein Cpin_6097 [Chitinophaga pinensis DSM 2588]
MTIFSCGRVKEKGQALISESKETVAEGIDEANTDIKDARESLKEGINQAKSTTKEGISQSKAFAKYKLNQAKQGIKERIDNVIPAYDADQPDTDNNKKRFQESFGIRAGSEVKQLYTYGDFMGIDYTVLMTFTCDKPMIKTIVEKDGLKLAEHNDDPGLSGMYTPDWWKPVLLPKVVCYKRGSVEEGYFKYLWYSPVSKQAFYEVYSI